MTSHLFRRFAASLLMVLLASPLWAVETALPVRRVALYKHGVAYFEREGKVDSGDVVMEFKASEMSDVLKSLTLLGAGGAVGGVSYEASEPLAKQLQQYAFGLPKEASIGQVLDQFKGARLVVRLASGGELRGAILGARVTLLKDGQTETIALMLDGGEMRNITLLETAGMRLEDPRLQRELDAYLQLVASSQRRDSRLLRIHPGAARELAVGYVIEAPVWKSSYRVVLDAKNPQEALLQGWAIVDNTTAEDWKGVSLALVSGLPVSFTQNLYQAHYVSRPNVPLPVEMAARPQAHEGVLVAGEKETPAERALKSAVQMRMRRDEAAAAPMAVAPAVIGGVAERIGVDQLARSVEVGATGRELGELFEYRIDRPVDIPRNQSAMIPFVQSRVKVERVLLYTPGGAGEHPYDAVLLENTTGKTLDGGAITVLEGNQYAGEALVETMKAGDSRPVSFAVDLGTRISTAFDSRVTDVFSVKVHRGTLSTKAKQVQTRTYTARNTDVRPKKLVVEHPVQPAWKLAEGMKPSETTARHYRFRLDLPARETAKLGVDEEREVSESIALTNLTPDLLAVYVRNKALSPAAQKQLEQMIGVREQLNEAKKEAAARQEEINELFRDQERLRQNINNLRSLPGQQEQVNAYVAKLTAQEKQLEALNAKLAAARNRARQLQSQLDQLMNTIEI